MSSTTQVITITSPNTRTKELALSARRLLNDLKELETGMATSNSCQYPRKSASFSSSTSRRRSLPCRTSSTSSHHHQSRLVYGVTLDHTSSAILAKASSKKRVSGTFVTFCDHLLFMNRVWKQERQLQALRSSIKASEKAKSSNAFKSFCDRLLLTNRIWQLERRVEELVAEGERNKRARVAAITHAAKQMAIDVRKESMIEEFVLDLIKELQENKKIVTRLLGEHEGEIRAIHGDWIKEYRRLARENERLQLEQQARLAEQDVSNELEQSLVDNLERSHQRIRELEQDDGDSTLVPDTFDHVSLSRSSSTVSWDGDMTDDLMEFDEGMSTVSSATCVSFQDSASGPGKSLGPSRILPRPQDAFSKQRRQPLHRQSVPLRKLVTKPYAGFSFNPLFFGNPETLVVSPSRVENTDTPVKVISKLSSPLPATTSRERKESMTRTPRLVGPAAVREPWRF